MRIVQWFSSLALLVSCPVSFSFPAEGAQKVSVGNHSLFLDCSGSGKGPTVIFLSGAGRDSTEIWNKVQPQVATFASACSYDRLNMGQSDNSAHVQTEEEIVEDLHQLLTNAKVAPPYILVGHSMGGLYARKFEEMYPRSVSGLVFVDSADEEQVWRYAKIAPMLLFEYPQWPHWDKLQAQGWLPQGHRLKWKTDVPLIVLEHGIMWPRGTFKGMTEEQYQNLKDTWHAMQVDLSTRSPSGELRIATKSGHYIQTSQPDIVIGAINDVLNRAKQ